jgi:hypothetical protein
MNTNLEGWGRILAVILIERRGFDDGCLASPGVLVLGSLFQSRYFTEVGRNNFTNHVYGQLVTHLPTPSVIDQRRDPH